MTGVTLMRMDAGVDTGPVVAQALVGISEADTTGSLTSRLAEEAARLLAQHLPRLGSQPVPVKAQEGSPTHAPRFRPGEEQLDFSQPARILWAKIRSMLPEPGPYTTVNGIRIKILVSQLVADTIPCGDIRRQGETWVIGCAEQSLRIITIKPAGRSPMTPGAYLRGLRTTPPTHVD